MKGKKRSKLADLLFVITLFGVGSAGAQWGSPNAYGYSTGYGSVYGSYGLASTMQSMYNVARAQSRQTAQREAMVKKWGAAAVEKAEREAAASKNSGSRLSSDPRIVVAPPRIVRNHGAFRPDSTVDTGKAFADSLGETAEEKALIHRIYTSTKAAYGKEAALKGWHNNIAGGLTFFTVAAMTVYHDAEEPGADAANSYYKLMNATLDEIPQFASVSNKDKQGFNNLMIGFGGLLLSGYIEGKNEKNAATIASYKQLAGMLIKMVLKTEPDHLRIENGQIVLK